MLIGLSQQKKNIAKQPVIPTKRQRVEGSVHRFDHIADGKCVDPSTRLRSLRMTWAGSFAKEQHCSLYHDKPGKCNIHLKQKTAWKAGPFCR